VNAIVGVGVVVVVVAVQSLVCSHSVVVEAVAVAEVREEEV
jgi:hypothetical protein